MAKTYAIKTTITIPGMNTIYVAKGLIQGFPRYTEVFSAVRVFKTAAAAEKFLRDHCCEDRGWQIVAAPSMF